MTMDTPQPEHGPDPGPARPPVGLQARSAVRLRAEAMRFLRRFGLVSALWSALLVLAAPVIDRPALVWSAVALHVAWALVAMVVRDDRAWWAGWFVVAVTLEVVAPLAGTRGWSITGGAIIVVLVGVALSGRRSWILATVASLSAVALGRSVLATDWPLANGVATCLLFAFGGLGLAWLVERIVAVVTERDRLQAQLLQAETAAARATERAEAGARLHDTVLQHLAAVVHAPDLATARRHAGRASNDLRQFLRRDAEETTSLRTLVQQEVTAAADGVEVSVSVSGDRAPDERDRLLVAATVEAVRNAVRHGSPPVRVLAELGPRDAARVWVADHGAGFDPTTTPADRLGVRDSIRGRMARAGGSATLLDQAGDADRGTEWELVLPATDPGSDGDDGPGARPAGT
ncbi:sensor histidine kinase [Salsipaludibacter albus]|uniref:sensor histidine kinase n=1 Tax=Salsipaludibacter albus TaxID=2849650 RepID=UPI001EE41EA4|nr:hypothetical protein [Salsipaludibacter albus]MBY5162557.1 hypothetical protein [Salsipaludibacter albus]